MTTILKILIVDDHDGMRQTLQDILEDESYLVSVAGSGEEALEICATIRFDIVLMDVRMPGLNGVETLRQLKVFAQETRVIMMSAYSIDDLRSAALQEGAIAFLKKPLDIAKVLSLIQENESPPALIVMDDGPERQKLQKNLDAENYRTYVTTSGHEALELGQQIHFSLIVVDIHLQSMSGLELYLALKPISPVSVAIMLADPDETGLKLARKAVQNNAYTYFTKPLDVTHLLSILHNLKKQQNSDILQKPREIEDDTAGQGQQSRTRR